MGTTTAQIKFKLPELNLYCRDKEASITGLDKNHIIKLLFNSKIEIYAQVRHIAENKDNSIEINIVEIDPPKVVNDTIKEFVV